MSKQPHQFGDDPPTGSMRAFRDKACEVLAKAKKQEKEKNFTIVKVDEKTLVYKIKKEE